MPTTLLCPDLATLSRYALGHLTEAELAQLADHVPTCRACLRQLDALDVSDELSEAVAAMRSATPPAHDPAITSLIGRLVSRSATRPAPDERDSRFEPAQADGEIGRLGHYRLLARLGAGGMGVVYRAVQADAPGLVALKVMRAELASDPVARQRFLQEGQAGISLRHPGIVAISEVGVADGPGGPVPFLAMEYLHGETLEAALERGNLPVGLAIRLARQVADALAAAHALGIVHRDIKPANIWWQADTGQFRLLDFGLAVAPHWQTLTLTGMLLGTPGYFSPEQAASRAVDGRSDLFSLGVVLYRSLTGRLPFSGPDVLATLTALAIEPPVPVRRLNPEVPTPLATLIERLLRKDPARRPSLDELRKVLDRLESHRRPRLRRIVGSTFGLLVALALLLLGVWLPRPGTPRPAAIETVTEPPVEAVSARPAAEQVAAVVAELRRRNPNYDGVHQSEVENGAVVGFELLVDSVSDLQPLAALTHLQRLRCTGAGLSDLAPLRGLPLRELHLLDTGVRDLRPLVGMPLAVLRLDGTDVRDLRPLAELPLLELRVRGLPVLDLAPLRGRPLQRLWLDFSLWREGEVLRAIPALVEINGQPAEAFWKWADSDQVHWRNWWEQMAVLPAQERADRVLDRSRRREPELSIEMTPTIRGGELVGWQGTPCRDLSSLAALTELRSLTLAGTAEKPGPTTNLWPLRGLPLEELVLDHNPVQDLRPLATFKKLRKLSLVGCPAEDLSPLRELPLTEVSVETLSPANREVLRGIRTLGRINGRASAEVLR